MKKQSMYFSKMTMVFILLFTNVATAIISYNIPPHETTLPNEVITGDSKVEDISENVVNEDCKKEEDYISAECPDYVLGVYNTYLNEESSSTLLTVNLRAYRDKEELQEKIRENIWKSFLRWMPEEFENAETIGNYVMLSTNKYLSMENDYRINSEVKSIYSVCNTFDMETGEVVYLDDLVYVDEELAKLILTEGIVKKDTIGESSNQSYIYFQEELDLYSVEEILKKLQICSIPYSADNYIYKPTFYLRYNRLYFKFLFTEQSEFYLELDDIEHKLKVSKW